MLTEPITISTRKEVHDMYMLGVLLLVSMPTMFLVGIAMNIR
jgi:hypothetical protein